MKAAPVRQHQFRVRPWMVVLAVVVVAILLSLRGLAQLYTDYLWFNSLGRSDTWFALLSAHVVPPVVFIVVFFVIMFVNLVVADRLAPHPLLTRNATEEDRATARYREVTARFAGRIRVGVSLFLAIVAGVGVATEWRSWILFTHRTDFGVRDPQFGKDVGFYVFQLPFIRSVLDWLFGVLVLVLIVTLVAHWLNGGIRFQSARERVSPQVKAHVSVLLAVMALVKTAQYYFGRFDLNFTQHGWGQGAGYTDVNVKLNAMKLLLVCSVVAAGLFLWNIRRRGWVLPVLAVGLWAFLSLVVGTMAPALYQKLKVDPNEFANERPYVARHIKATRAAYGLNNVQPRSFDYTEDLSSAVVDANRPTIDNARLWDPDVIALTYQGLQGLRDFYRIADVDVDRYLVDGQVTQTVIATRELNPSKLPSSSWVVQHVQYTHGYGVVASPTNTSLEDGNPEFFVSDIPTSNAGIDVGTKGARIYFGEDQVGYVVVGARQAEFDYERQGQVDATTRYTGKDGVKVDNPLKRAAFALRFGDFNALISDQVTSNSKILMVRDVRERVHKLAPFLDFDADPYPVVINGRVTWVLDAYTTTPEYPYSQRSRGGSNLPSELNYIRNSVKATVDAYDGTVTFWVVDPKDPIVRAYAKAFPGLFTSMSRMPAELQAHLRYPEDILSLQAEVYARYHVTQTRRFFSGTDWWSRSPDPQALRTPVITGSASRTSQTIRPLNANTPRQNPYYLYLRLPGDRDESFLGIQPFVPFSEENNQLRLVSFLTAKSDPGDYGKLETFEMPRGSSVPGPVQAATRIEQETSISEQITLLDRSGSKVQRGNVQLIPVGDSILYVRPYYLQGQDITFPRFQFVAVLSPGQPAVTAGSVNDALNLLFGTATPPSSPTSPSGSPANATVKDLLDRAAQAFDASQEALKRGDLAEYQRQIQLGVGFVNQARTATASAAATGGAGTTTTTSGR